MLQVVTTTPSGEGKEVRSSMVGKSRKRKPWEFTWDGTIDGADSIIESPRVMPERRVKKRKAWEFTWDDQDGGGLSAVSPSVIRQESDLEPAKTSTNTPDVFAQSSSTSSPLNSRSERPVGREKTKKDVTDCLLSSDSVETAPSLILKSNADNSLSESINSETMDIEKVRRQFLSIGQSVFKGKSTSVQEDVSWIRPPRSRREVQVVHVRSGSKHHVREIANGKDLDDSLRTHPLIENALHVLSLLRNNHKEENLNALRRAVRILREQVAGLEAQAYAYARPSRLQIPLFKQAYDPKTRTG